MVKHTALHPPLSLQKNRAWPFIQISRRSKLTMRESAFQEWYRARGRVDDTLLTDARRVNNEIANLDEGYNQNHLRDLLNLLAYSKEDERNGKANLTGMTYNSGVQTGTSEYYRRLHGWYAAYRGSVENYRDFRNELVGGAIHPEESDESPFDPTDDKDGRTKVIQALYVRRGQADFRRALREAYNDKCSISACEVLDVLEAAHIKPWRGTATNDPSNGLLLRADLHTLFDCGLISIDEKTLCVIVDDTLMRSDYKNFHGLALAQTTTKASSPNREAVKWHKVNVYDNRQRSRK